MKNSDKNIEQKMKQILENQEIDFLDSDWEAAQMLIQNANLSAPKKRRRFGLWIFMFLFSVGSFAFYFGAKEKGNKEISEVKRNISNTREIESHCLDESITPSKSIHLTEKEVTNNFNSKMGSLAQTPTYLNRNAEKQNDNSAKLIAFSGEKSPQNTKENTVLFSETEKNTLTIKTADSASKSVDNQLNPTSLPLSSNTTSLPQQKVWAIEKPNFRLNSAFYPPQNITPLPDFPLKNNRFSLQVFAGIASAIPEKATYKPTFYGGLQTTYQLHKNCKILLFSELSTRNVQFKNSNIIQNNILPDAPASNNLDFQSICEPSNSVTNVTVISRASISRDLLYYGGLGVGFVIPYKRHEFSLTCAFQKVLDTRSDYELDTYQNGNLIYQEKKKVSGFMEGLHKQDVTFGIAYQYAINHNLQLQISGNFGSKDMSNDAYYGNSIKDRNAQIRAGIVYRFWH